ncbi:MAG: hypothetical protein U0984_08005 [Prosthecobacter sp.]|nr:hypothetical protein [Prosthecobacter sp.]
MSPPDAAKAKLDFMLQNHGNSIESVEVATMAQGSVSYSVRYRPFGSNAHIDALLTYIYHRGRGWKLQLPSLADAEPSP